MLNRLKNTDISNLYFVKYRYYFYDFVCNIYEDDKLISPRPDYYEDYIILIKKDDKFLDFNTESWEFFLNIEDKDNLVGSGKSIILEISSLNDFLDLAYLNTGSINHTQSDFVLSTIVKTKSLTRKYKNINRK